MRTCQKEYIKNKPRFIRSQTCYSKLIVEIGLGPVEIGFTARQVVKVTGLPYSTLNLWAKTGLVQPSVSPAKGTGTERVYSFSDLVALKVAFELRKSGVTTSSLKKVIEFLRQQSHMRKPLSETRLVVTGRDVAIVERGELVSVLSRPGQAYLSFVFDLPRMLDELANVADATNAFAQAVETVSGSGQGTKKKQPRSVHVSGSRKRNRT